MNNLSSLCVNPNCNKFNDINHKFCQYCRTKIILQERYQAIKIIGQGGFGRTFLAIDKGKPSKPYCVIKQFFPSAQGTETLQKASDLFALEAERLEQLGNHDQIPDLLAYFTHEDNRQYLVQQYIEGPNLLKELETQGQFKESEIRKLLIDMLNVLKFIHAKQVIHRDIKPENIIRREADKKLVLVDFGAAKHATPTQLGVTGTVIGSQQYCAPEQSRGKPEFPSDLYSLGVTCLHLITATNPFDLFDTNENDWVWRDHLKGNAVSQELGDILDKMIQFGTKKRYQSADEMLAVLTPKKVVTPPTPAPIKKVVTTPTPAPTPKATPTPAPTPKATPTPDPTQNNTPTPAPSPVIQVELKPDKGVNYTKLRDLLAAAKWKEADRETGRVMLEAANRTKQGYLDRQSIENFPCEDLRTIDQLWVKYSNGRFGFSVQKQIWLELGGKVDYETECKLGDRVQWRSGGRWLDYSDYSELTFDLSAPPGHLPRWDLEGWCGRGGVSSLAQRLVTCKIPQSADEMLAVLATKNMEVELKPDRGVNYTTLRDLLAAGKWREADQETARVMVEVANRTKEGYLNSKSIENFPCEDLRTIDQLWVKYSHGRFGFSVQKQIWLECGGKVDRETEEKLGDRLQWRKEGRWQGSSDLTFDLSAPPGHLPAFSRKWGYKWERVFRALLSRKDL